MSFIVIINKELSFGLSVGPKNDRTFLKTSSHDYINTEIYIWKIESCFPSMPESHT